MMRYAGSLGLMAKEDDINSVYTFKDGGLFCMADSMKTEYMHYYKRKGIDREKEYRPDKEIVLELLNP